MKLTDVAKKMILVLCISLLVIVVASVVYYRSFSFLPFAAGALLGTSLNILKVALLDRAVSKAVNMDKNDSGNYIRLQYLSRYLLTGAVLVLAAMYSSASNSYAALFGTVAGLFTMPVAALSMNLFYGGDTNAKE
jgi:hypothetical protein